MVAPLGLGVLLIVVGLALFFVPGIGIIGIVAIVIGALLVVGGFATRGRTTAPPP